MTWHQLTQCIFDSVSDSSRYFVLRISDGKGRKAYVGIGFNDRAHAFDFKVGLQDAQRQSKPEVEVNLNSVLELIALECHPLVLQSSIAQFDNRSPHFTSAVFPFSLLLPLQKKN